MRVRALFLCCWAAALAVTFWTAPGAGESAESSGIGDASGPALREGEVITFDQVGRLEPYLPPELWSNREFVFYEGMQLGPSFADYSPPPVYQKATQDNRRQRAHWTRGEPGRLCGGAATSGRCVD